jgi:hypothetical protein
MKKPSAAKKSAFGIVARTLSAAGNVLQTNLGAA